MEVDSDEEDEEEAKQSAQPYMSLMRSLVESAPHKAKRRKLDHPSAENKEPSKPEPEPPAKNEDEDEEEGRDVDLVEEPEEDPADAAPEDLFDEDDDLDSSDPFEVHFANPGEEELQPRLKAIQESKWRMERVAGKSTRIFLNTPDVGAAEGKSLPAPVSGITDLKLKKRLQEAMATKHPKFDQVEQTIAPLLFNYQDILYCNRTVPGSQGIRRMACLHALNHVFKCVHHNTHMRSN
jgi:U3 small nucleolar RNA-associated protein 25